MKSTVRPLFMGYQTDYVQFRGKQVCCYEVAKQLFEDWNAVWPDAFPKYSYALIGELRSPCTAWESTPVAIVCGEELCNVGIRRLMSDYHAAFEVFSGVVLLTRRKVGRLKGVDDQFVFQEFIE